MKYIVLNVKVSRTSNLIFKGKILTGYINAFSANEYEKNDNMVYNYFKAKYDRRKCNTKISIRKKNETKKYFTEKI